MTWFEMLAKFCSAADWTKEEFETHIKSDPFWRDVHMAYTDPPVETLIAKDNALVSMLRRRAK